MLCLAATAAIATGNRDATHWATSRPATLALSLSLLWRITPARRLTRETGIGDRIDRESHASQRLGVRSHSALTLTHLLHRSAAAVNRECKVAQTRKVHHIFLESLSLAIPLSLSALAVRIGVGVPADLLEVITQEEAVLVSAAAAAIRVALRLSRSALVADVLGLVVHQGRTAAAILGSRDPFLPIRATGDALLPLRITGKLVATRLPRGSRGVTGRS